ncbi:MAG: hypothetical protein L0H64_17370 [Pseudonocardia sp.]|nr:hypothetical protein [Pseudonocardia sp.]
MTVGFGQRLRASGLSPWELGDLLGVHPHQLDQIEATGLSTERTIAVLLELARRLDLHPADLVADLDAVLTNRRRPDGTRGDDLHNDDRGHHHGAEQSDRGADARVLLTVLAHARTPLSIDELAGALGWLLGRVHEALSYAHQHPAMAGPMMLRRVPPETFTLAPRLDILTVEQQQAVQTITGRTSFLAEEEAIVLLGALAYGHDGPRYATFRDTESHRHAHAALERAGILSIDHTHRVNVDDDVLYSLRYRDDTHIATEHAAAVCHA